MKIPPVDFWRTLLREQRDKTWVLFKQGTCVVLERNSPDPISEAKAFLKEEGQIKPGSSGGDFSVVALRETPGWIVTCHRDNIFTYVAPDEMENRAGDLQVGLLGRSKRHQDSQQLEVVHVEKIHSAPSQGK